MLNVRMESNEFPDNTIDHSVKSQAYDVRREFRANPQDSVYFVRGSVSASKRAHERALREISAGNASIKHFLPP